MKDITLADLFSGIGGFHKGFEQAGFNITKSYFSEVDKYAQSIYMRRFPESVRLGDVTKVNDGLGEVDIITAGFPCQAFSIAGKREGFNDTRGTLFFDVARLAKKYRPRYMVLENVKGLLNHERGDTMRVILDELGRLDYHTEVLLLNTKDFGVPQNRERVFFICTARGERRPEVFRLRERKTEIDADNTLSVSTRNKTDEWHNSYSPCQCATNYKDPHKVAIPVLSPDRVEKRQNGRRFKENVESDFTLTTQDRHGILQIGRGYNKGGIKENCSTITKNSFEHNNFVYDFNSVDIRRLTPTECEKLQGFPIDWTKYGHEGQIISDSQRHKCLGNSVTVDVIEAIAREIKAVL